MMETSILRLAKLFSNIGMKFSSHDLEMRWILPTELTLPVVTQSKADSPNDVLQKHFPLEPIFYC